MVYHDRSQPKGKPGFHHGPLVIIDINGERYAIDGNNRVNLWRSSDVDGPHEAIIVTPKKALSQILSLDRVGLPSGRNYPARAANCLKGGNSDHPNYRFLIMWATSMSFIGLVIFLMKQWS